MLIFLSWSGKKSKAVAEALKDWLVKVVQAVEPWISSDIEKGTRWNAEMLAKLEQTRFGIICLTRENLDARWILFEAGALSKIKDTYVCTILLDITPGEVEQPLSQFQHTTIEKSDMRKLIGTINNAVNRTGERGLPDITLNNIFETFWPQLEKSFADIGEAQEDDRQKFRTDRSILEEIVEILRSQEIRPSKGADTLPFSPANIAPHLLQSNLSRHMLRAWVKMRGESLILSKVSGTLRYVSFNTELNAEGFDDKMAIRNKDGVWVVVRNNAKIVILDKSGKELERHPVSYGDMIKLPDQSLVKPLKELVQRDPFSIPVLCEVTGKVAYGDIIDNVTVTEEIDKITGIKFKTVIEISGSLRPRIAIKDENNKTVRLPDANTVARFLLPVGTRILVNKGDKVFPEDVLAKIPMAATDV